VNIPFVSQPDVILLHAPSVYDFRQEAIVYGPVSDLIPSTPIFEMYPVGFASMAAYLRAQGHRVRIVNLAVRMLRNPKFDVDRFVRGLRPKLFGIDLHWLPHCQGAVEVARVVKAHHPDIPIVFGGFSSTFFHEELVAYPQVDFVIRGDSAEKPLAALLAAVERGGGYEAVPNLTWKEDGEVRVNELSHTPTDIDEFVHGYEEMTRSVVRYGDLASVLPFYDWMDYPIMPVMATRGCNKNCVFCGGANYAFKGTMEREHTAFRSPEALLKDIRTIAGLSRGPIFIIGDPYQPGAWYADRLLRGFAEHPVPNHIIIEFFSPPPADFSARIADAIPNHAYEMSMESHDPLVRTAAGKGYTNEELEESVPAALRYGAERFDLYYIIGLPKQTADSVMATIEYCDHLYSLVKGDPRLTVFISPLAPFLDPGSRGFMEPERFGYRLNRHTLEEHRRAMLEPSWKYTLNYETEWLDRDALVDVTYRSALALNEVKRKWGVIPASEADVVERRIHKAVEVMKRVDDILAEETDAEARRRRILALKGEVDEASISTVCDTRELEWPLVRGLTRFRPGGLVKAALHRTGPRPLEKKGR
jgi:B12-binding domain/radical SAM domain protein